MKNVDVVSQKQRLDVIFAKAKRQVDDVELVSHWAKYLCVLVSGFIEESVRVLIVAYVEKRAGRQVANFVASRVESFQNAKMEKILMLAAEFDSLIGESLRRETEGEMKDSIDSIVANRHLIAHGRDVGISLARVEQWYKNVIGAVEQIEAHFPS